VANKKSDESYDWACFQILAYEFEEDDPGEAERKIRRKLSRSHLGAYDHERIAKLRSLKDELQREIGLFDRSKYYVGPKGPYAALVDFDVDQLVEDFAARYPTIAKDDLRGVVGFALYLYYLR